MKPTEALMMIEKQLMKTPQNIKLFEIIRKSLPKENDYGTAFDNIFTESIESLDNMCLRYEKIEEE